MDVTQPICVYCRENLVLKPSEHVFPKGLGGLDADKYKMDCVCNVCNQLFGETIEDDLLRKSPIALMRSKGEVEGYRKNKKLRPNAITYPDIFILIDDENLYEAGIYGGDRYYYRPQFIQISGAIYCYIETMNDGKSFIPAIKQWYNNNGFLVRRAFAGQPAHSIKFVLHNGLFEASTDFSIPAKNYVKLLLSRENDPYRHFIEPRLFYSEEKKLVLRSRTINEGVDFLERVINNHFIQERAS